MNKKIIAIENQIIWFHAQNIGENKMGQIWVTADIHGDASRFSVDSFPEQKEMLLTEENYMIQLGDFGLVWQREKESKNEKWWLDWLNDKPFKTLFIDGNHENHIRLNQYPEKEWHGGIVNEIRPNVLHLKRGHVFDIEGKKFFAFGGSASHDISDGILDYDDSDWREKAKVLDNQGKYMYRVRGLTWWDREMPSEEEMEAGLKNLERVGNKADFIITHCASSSTAALISHGMYKPDKLTDYLERIKSTVDYKTWLMGHYHRNDAVNDKEIILYEQIVRIV